MTQQITWTHVDKLVREELENRGILPSGKTDAEVAYDFLGFICVQHDRAVDAGSHFERSLSSENTRLKKELAEIKNRPIGKTKQRLAELEKQVAKLTDHFLGIDQ